MKRGTITDSDSSGKKHEPRSRRIPDYTSTRYVLVSDLSYPKPSTRLPKNAPFSAIVCGVQGSGKSHTVSVLLENMLVPNCKPLGFLEKPLAGLVLHFGTGGENCLPCEAAWLASPKYHGVQVPPVKVYVSQSVLNRMRRIYAPLGENVTVEPLQFTEAELDAQAFLSMMAVESSDSAPLYMQVFLVGEPTLPIPPTLIHGGPEHP